MIAVRALLALLAVLFGGGALVLAFVAVRTAQRLRAWRSWKRVPATVTSVDWESRPEGQGALLVVFDVEGQMSTALDVGNEAHKEDEREALLQRFAVGSQHEALVEPSRASPPLLVTGLVQQPVVPLIIGGIFTVLAAVMAGLAWYLGQPGNALSRILG